jgi:ABC-type dipeptide/oligopeptide/nickel transport system permease subunit
VTITPGGLDPGALGEFGAEGALLAPQVEGGEVYGTGGGWRLTLKAFAENWLALAGIGVIVFFLLFSFLGPHIYHSSPAQILYARARPGKGIPLGRDQYGNDELGQMIKGGQSSLEIGFLTAAIAVVVGTLWGAIAGLAGGVVDGVMMRLVDIGLAIPTLFIVLILAVYVNVTVVSFSIIIGLNQWLVPARLVRAEVLTLRERDFVAAGTSMGASRTRLLLKHLIPNALGVVIVNITFQIADAILYTSVVGFLGFGLHYPQVDWGDMLSDGVNYLYDGYWWLIYPVGICLILVVMAFNFIGDAARDAVDVRLRKR